MANRCNELRGSDIQCPKFTLAGEVRYAKVVSVYDGDTLRANFFLREDDPSPIQMSFRLSGYDTAEMRSDDPNERQRAERARDALRKLSLGRIVRIEMEGLDKYGRVLARMFVRRADTRDELCVNQWILDCGLGRRYNGGRKETAAPSQTGGAAPEVPAVVDIDQ